MYSVKHFEGKSAITYGETEKQSMDSCHGEGVKDPGRFHL